MASVVASAALGAITAGASAAISGGGLAAITAGTILKGAALGGALGLASDILSPDQPKFSSGGGGGGGVPSPSAPTPPMPSAPGTPAANPNPTPVGGGAPTEFDVAEGNVLAERQRRGRLSTILSSRKRITEPLGGLYDNETLG